MPNAEQSSSTNAEVKFAPLSLSNLAGMPNTEINHSNNIRVRVLAFWSLVTNAMEYLVKWSVITNTFFMLGGWFQFHCHFFTCKVYIN